MAIDPHWIVPDWPAPARVKALVTTRHGGASTGSHASLNLSFDCGDDPACVRENRERLRAHLPAEPKWMQQVHATRIIAADRVTRVEAADASIAREAGTVCVVMIADCLPVLLCSAAGDVIGIAHAGWRGLAAGVIEATVQAMACPPADLIAWLGPAIGPDAFEVGDEVHTAFIEAGHNTEPAFRRKSPHKWLADLHELARERLRKCGILSVHGAPACTYGDPERFFSYRRARTTGRMAALLWMEPRSD
jgi:YfiH family protein